MVLKNMEIYRLKEAFMIFWAVLAHKNYLFASSRYSDKAKGCLFFTSEPAEHNKNFLESVIEMTNIIKKQSYPDATFRTLEIYDILNPQYKDLLERADKAGTLTEEDKKPVVKDHVFKETVY